MENPAGVQEFVQEWRKFWSIRLQSNGARFTTGIGWSRQV